MEIENSMRRPQIGRLKNRVDSGVYLRGKLNNDGGGGGETGNEWEGCANMRGNMDEDQG